MRSLSVVVPVPWIRASRSLPINMLLRNICKHLRELLQQFAQELERHPKTAVRGYPRVHDRRASGQEEARALRPRAPRALLAGARRDVVPVVVRLVGRLGTLVGVAEPVPIDLVQPAPELPAAIAAGAPVREADWELARLWAMSASAVEGPGCTVKDGGTDRKYPLEGVPCSVLCRGRMGLSAYV